MCIIFRQSLHVILLIFINIEPHPALTNILPVIIYDNYNDDPTIYAYGTLHEEGPHWPC